MKKYLVFQHGACTMDKNQRIKVFPLPPGVKIVFLTRPAKTTNYKIAMRFIQGGNTHIIPAVYSKPGALVPNLHLSYDYDIEQINPITKEIKERGPMLGHTWTYSNVERNITKSNKNVHYINENVKRIVRNNKKPGSLKKLILLMRYTDLYTLVRKLGPGEYIVASCRRFQEQKTTKNRINQPNKPNTTGNARYNVLRRLNAYGGVFPNGIPNNMKPYLNYRMPVLKFRRR